MLNILIHILADFETLSNDARGIMAEEKHSLFEEER
jgi:hypothetical protein